MPRASASTPRTLISLWSGASTSTSDSAGEKTALKGDSVTVTCAGTSYSCDQQSSVTYTRMEMNTISPYYCFQFLQHLSYVKEYELCQKMTRSVLTQDNLNACLAIGISSQSVQSLYTDQALNDFRKPCKRERVNI